MLNSKLRYAQIFVESKTFKVWQGYCRLKKLVLPHLGINSTYIPRKPTIENIKKYVLPSKAFAVWLPIYSTIDVSTQFVKQKIPQPIKTRLKIIASIFRPSISVNAEIVREWHKWFDARPDSSLDIINFGITPYHYRFQRPQQLANSLVKSGHRIFYIETEFNLALSPKQVRLSVKKIQANLYVVTIASPINYFIYRDTPSSRAQAIMFASIKLLMSRAHIINPVAKIDHPFWGILAEKLNMWTVYDVMDLHTGFAESGGSTSKKHDLLVKKADLLLASSHYLMRTLKRFSSKTILLPNAADFTHFSQATKTNAKPTDIANLRGPIVGYYGAIAEWLDTDLIANVAQKLPNINFVFIGRVQNQKLIQLSAQLPNLHLLGEKPYAKLPHYLTYFDVCHIPFKLTPLIQATNPVKIYEYFAAGKPVVSTLIPELKPFKDLLYFGSNHNQYVRAIRLALQDHSTKKFNLRQKVAEENTWELRSQLLSHELRARFFPKVSVIILVYNHADLSQISIDSVLTRSKYGNLELIAVDNKSDSQTLRMLKGYAHTPNIKLIFNPENFGFAKGNNIGLQASSGDYLILLNNDVRVTPGWIERLVYHAHHNPRVGLVGPVTNSIGNESKINIQYDWNNAQEIESKSAAYIYSHWGTTIPLRNIAAFAWLSPRSVYKQLGGLDERFGRGLFEDDDYCMRVRQAHLDILVAEDSFVHHYGGASTNWGSPEFQTLFNTNKAKFEAKWKIKWIPHQYRKGVK